MRQRQTPDSPAAFDALPPDGLTRRTFLHRSAALTLSVPLAAMLHATPGPSRLARATEEPPTGDPITIGAALPLTGTNGSTGSYLRDAYELWAAQKNEAGGLLGRPVALTILDDESDPEISAGHYTDLIEQQGVDLVLGPYGSPVTQAVAAVTERSGYPVLAAGAATPSLWEQDFQYLFGVFSVADDYFRDIIRDLAPAQGYATAAIIHEDTLFPTAVATGAAEHCAAAGIDVILTASYPAEATDVSAVLTQVRDADPDLLIGGSYFPDAVLVMRQAKDIGVNPRLFAFSVGVPQPDFAEQLGADANYVLGPSMWEPHVETPGNAEFVAAFEAMFDREPAYQAANAYAACQVLEAATSAAGSLDRAAIRDELLGLDMETILPGRYQVDDTGKMIGHVPLAIQWQDGEKRTVAPENLADAEPLLPTPPWDERDS